MKKLSTSKLKKKRTKATIRLGVLKGRVERAGVKILYPFNTSIVQMPQKELPRFGHLVFDARLDSKGNIEYTFSSIDLTCSCEKCCKKL